MSNQTALSSCRMLWTTPVPSMWPDTMCPPNRPFADSARSRFTASPGESAPSDERSSVSGMMSAENVDAVKRVTVKQTPLTAMLSPVLTSDSTVRAATVSSHERAPRRSERTRPTSSTMPVNT